MVTPLLGLVACGFGLDEPTQASGRVVPTAENPALVVTLSVGEARAGQAVGVLAFLDGGAESVPVEVDISSDLEELQRLQEAIVPTRAGVHALHASASYGGELFEADLELPVTAAWPASIDLQLSDLAMPAGDGLQFAVAGTDPWGNTVTDLDVAVTVSQPAVVTVGDGALTSTTPGIYTLTATSGLLQDTETFLVTAGLPTALTLTVAPMTPERGDTSLATVIVSDAFGNAVPDEVRVWAEPSTGVDVNATAVTFYEEGTYTIRASTADGSLIDSVGPITVDSTGPDLVISSPARGTETTSTSQNVAGTVTDAMSGVASVTVNGVPATVAGSAFSVTLGLDHGMNIVEVVAVDGDGNASTDVRALLSGAYTPYGGTVPTGILARLYDNGLDMLEDMALGLLDLDTLLAGFPNPVFYDVYEECLIFCITVYELELSLTRTDFGAVTVDIDPRADGLLRLTGRVEDIRVDYEADGVVLEIGYGASGAITADAIELVADLRPVVSGGTLDLEVVNTTVNTTNFNFDFNSWIYDVVSFFGVDIEGMVEDLLVDSIRGLVEDEVPALLAEAFQDLELAFDLELADNTYTLGAEFTSATVDDHGLNLGMGTSFTAATVLSAESSPGSLTLPYTTPTFGASADEIALGLSLDFFNQMLYGLWKGGLLELQMTEEDLGVDPADLELLFPGITGLTIDVSASLPPVALPAPGALLELQIGDIGVTLYDGPVDPANVLMQLYVSAEAELSVALNADATALELGIGAMDLHFDLTAPTDARADTIAAAEGFLASLVPMLLPALTSAVTEFPIPEIEGLAIRNATMTLEGPESGFIVLAGEIDGTLSF